MPFKDPEKKKAYAREFYKKSEERRRKTYEAVAARRKKIQKQIADYKRTLACIMCGESHPDCLEFHHVDPRTKDHNPSELVRKRGWSFEKIKEHVETTCLCLCANCHRKVHSKLRVTARESTKKIARKSAKSSRTGTRENPNRSSAKKRVQSTSRKHLNTKTRSKKDGSRPKSSSRRPGTRRKKTE